jgi:hypothetical protein
MHGGVQMDKKIVVVKQVSIGNQPAGSKLFSVRKGIQPHMHKPGDYYCGRCMHYVRV